VRTLSFLVAALWLGGCSAGEEPCEEGSTRASDGNCFPASAYGDHGSDSGAFPEIPWAPDEDSESTWTSEEVASAIDEGLVAGFPEVADLVDAYLELLAHGDEDCPGDPTQLTDAVLYGCTTDEGYTYAGISTYDVQEAETSVEALGADFRILTPTGERYEAGGYIALWTSEYGGTEYRGAEIEGSWIWEGSDGAASEGLSTVMYAFRTLDEEGELRLIIDGSLGVWGSAMVFEGLEYIDNDCGGFPTGVVRIREPSGVWVAWTAEDSCSECGQVTVDDEVLGEGCVDLRPAVEALLDQLEAP
jgi:hypothetical protein